MAAPRRKKRESIGVREFCRRAEAPLATVERYLNSGKLPRNSDGTIPWPDALDEWNRIKNEKEERELNASELNEAIDRADLARKQWDALRRELEYQLRKGELLQRADARSAYDKLVERFGTALDLLCSRVAPALASIPDSSSRKDALIKAAVRGETDRIKREISASPFGDDA